MNIHEQFELVVSMWKMLDDLSIESPLLEFYREQFVTLRNHSIELTNLYNDIILALGQKDYTLFLTLIQELERKSQENPLEQ